jgi:predicted transcriptional regulator
MAAITIELPDAQTIRLKELANEVGVTPEELLRAGIEEWLRDPSDEFARAAAYVLKKNAELYRRLA